MLHHISLRPCECLRHERAVWLTAGCLWSLSCHFRIFRVFDSDGDGTVNYEEFLAFVLHCDLTAVADGFDSDSDGEKVSCSISVIRVLLQMT